MKNPKEGQNEEGKVTHIAEQNLKLPDEPKLLPKKKRKRKERKKEVDSLLNSFAYLTCVNFKCASS